MIKSVYNGIGVMEENLLENLAKSTGIMAAGFHEEGYSARELDIVKAVAEGLSNKEIAVSSNGTGSVLSDRKKVKIGWQIFAS